MMEDYEDYYENDDFESQHADELEALRELEQEQPPKVNYKRKLVYENFTDKKNSQSNSDSEENLANEFIEKEELPPNAKRAREASNLTIINDKKNDSVQVDVKHVNNITNTNAVKPRKLDFTRESISVTSFTGNRIQVYFRSETDCDLNSLSIKPQAGSLLAVPYTVLRDQIEKERELNLLRINSLNETLPEPNSLFDEFECTLWVEKFKPRQFIELLSDDGINRTLLFWLKQWDTVVFNKDKEEKIKMPKIKPKLPLFVVKESYAMSKLKEVDDLKRPFFKIALLCGPPGLGKTTLAYIIAKHAGYNIVEMNASDDRSQDIFQRQLESATQMKSVMGEDPKPNCLIIDEIDGAPAPSINLLVSYVKAVRSGKKKSPILLRPIICICNDLYTTALRPLKQIAFVLNFPPTASGRLATRLMGISRIEHMKTDRTALLALCDKTENDIRSCLSTLQFLRDANKDLKFFDVQNMSIGQKDMRKSIFSIWQSVFQVPRSKKRQNFSLEEIVLKTDEASPTGRFQNILHIVQSFGESDKIIQGVFENYLSINFKDPLLDSVVKGTEWLSHTDLMQQQIANSQIYSLLPYIPYCVVMFHFLFAVPISSKLNYPSAQFEQRSRQTQLTSIVESMYSYMCPNARSFLTISTVAMQLLPWLSAIIQPVLRPVNIQLYSNREKFELKQVIAVMVAYNLFYRQERNAEGQYSYILEPNIEDVICYPGLKVDQGLSYAAKNLISRELEVEKMRRNEGKVEVKEVSVVPKDKETQGFALPNHKQVLRAKEIKEEEERVAVDFFGREILNKKKVDTFENSNALGTGIVWFHFKEGYSNAARHTVLIKDLL